MTIRKGQEWATPVTQEVIDAAITVSHDAELAAEALRTWDDGERLVVVPSHGDLLKTIGLDTARRDSTAMAYSWDLGLVELYSRNSVRRVPFVSHVVLRRRIRLGRVICIMNTPWFGRYRLGPKAHPNDGLLDLTDGVLPLGQLIQARRRALVGTHVPHPALQTARVSEWGATFDRKMVALIDQSAVTGVKQVKISLIPDAFTVVA